jgi:hypothetical protein
MARAVGLIVEYLGHETGLWCDDCALSTGIRVTVAATTAGATTLTSAVHCYGCGGKAVH